MREVCYICGSEFASDGLGTGYGVDRHGHKLCYECIGRVDKRRLERMRPGDRTDLYVTAERRDGPDGPRQFTRWYVQNWPGTFRHSAVHNREGFHNIAGVQNHYYFCIRAGESRDGRAHRFHGVCFGRWTEVLHVRKLKFEERGTV